jgi:hypothetical protein
MDNYDVLNPHHIYTEISVSPTNSSSPPPPKRRRLSQFFAYNPASTTSEENRSLSDIPRRRKSSSFLSLFGFQKTSRKAPLYDGTADVNETRSEQEQGAEISLSQNSLPYKAVDGLVEGGRRRSSLAKIMDFLTLRKRKDSGVEESGRMGTLAPWGAGNDGGLQYFSERLEPLAMGKLVWNKSL